ncbi:hypothetical protein [Citrobacter freundii]|uniref:hypothetical protein n=1 Tax=Citrobacter freundii TaxID=546 RepID=UPI003B672A5D
MSTIIIRNSHFDICLGSLRLQCDLLFGVLVGLQNDIGDFDGAQNVIGNGHGTGCRLLSIISALLLDFVTGIRQPRRQSHQENHARHNQLLQADIHAGISI